MLLSSEGTIFDLKALKRTKKDRFLNDSIGVSNQELNLLVLEFTVSTVIHIKCTKLDIKPNLNDVKKVYIGYPVQLKEE